MLDLNISTFPLLHDHLLHNRVVVPAALALTQLRNLAEHTTARPQRHLTAFQVLHGVSFSPADSVQLSQHAQHTQDACRVSLHKGDRVCYQALAMHDAAPPTPSTRVPVRPDLSDIADTYAKILFHGQRLQLLTKISAPHQQSSSAAFAVSPNLDNEIALLEAALQLAIVHIQRRFKLFSLPAAIGGYRLFSTTLPSQGLVSVRMIARRNAHVLLEAELTDNTQLLARLDAIEMIVTQEKRTRAN